MEKPLNLRLQETKDKIADIINNAKLPAYLLKPIVKDFYLQLQNLEQEEFMKSQMEYQNSLNTENVENVENSEKIEE